MSCLLAIGKLTSLNWSEITLISSNTKIALTKERVYILASTLEQNEHFSITYFPKEFPDLPVEKYFDVTEIELDVYVKNKVTNKMELIKAKRSLVYCTDPNGFVELVKKERGIENDENVEGHLGMDGGGGFMKLCLNLVKMKKGKGQSCT